MHYLIFLLPLLLKAGVTEWSISTNTSIVPQGGILELKISGPTPTATPFPMVVKWKDQEVAPFQNPGNISEWIVYFGIPHDAHPGKEEIILAERKIPFEIKEGGFKSESLRVDPSKVKLNQKDTERAAKEREEVQAIYKSAEPIPYWKEEFKKPIESILKSSYGTRRLFNGEQMNHHSGTDFRAGIGAKVRAANKGKVRLAKELFFAGNMILIDHGGGLFTSYAHLSRIDVKTGDVVSRGQVIGKAGDTGRVSGPHLHWGLRVHGSEADPLELLKLNFKK